MGHVEIIKNLPMNQLGSEDSKDIYVYTPDTNKPSILMVIYDSQYVFRLYPTKSFMSINTYVDLKINRGDFPPITIVGIASTYYRLSNLSPWQLHIYQDFVSNTVIPFIETNYNVKRPYINIGFSASGQLAIYMANYTGMFDIAGAIIPLWFPPKLTPSPTYHNFTYIIIPNELDVDVIQHTIGKNFLYEIIPDVDHNFQHYRKLLPNVIEVLINHVQE